MDSLASNRQGIGSNLVLAGLVLKILLDLCYIHYISPSYSYMGMTLSLNYQKLVESYLITLALLLILSWRPRSPSTIILIVGLVAGVIPIVSIYALQDRFASFTYISVISFVISFIITTMPRIRVKYLNMTPEIIFGGCVLFLSVAIFLLIVQGSYKYFTLNLYSIYDYRRELGGLVFIGPFEYVVHWAHGVFNICLLIWALHYRNKALAVGVVVIQMFLYGCTLLKALLLNVPLVVLIYYIIERRGDVVLLLWLFCFGIALGMLETMVLGQDNIIDLITRRVMALPPYLANEYFELFRDIGHVYWTNGLLGSVAPYPFTDDPPHLVGKVAMGNSETWANNGMFGMGFMQAGFVGMLFYGVVYGLWLYVIDCITVGRVPTQVAVSMVIVPTLLVVTDTDLPTTLLTHGGIAATLMLWLWGGIVVERKGARAQAMNVAAHASRSS